MKQQKPSGSGSGSDNSCSSIAALEGSAAGGNSWSSISHMRSSSSCAIATYHNDDFPHEFLLALTSGALRRLYDDAATHDWKPLMLGHPDTVGDTDSDQGWVSVSQLFGVGWLSPSPACETKRLSGGGTASSGMPR